MIGESTLPSSEGAAGPPPVGAGKRTWLLGALVLAIAALLNADLLTGSATPFYRDLGTTQRPARELYASVGVASLGRASLNPYASYGQPYWGNPNYVLAYPFPTGSRFLGFHLLFHLALGALGATLFLRRFVRAPEAALVGGLSFGLSGYVVSSTAFVNATTTIAWIPWLLLSTHGLRGTTWPRVLVPVLGVAATSALLVLGGEPALAAIGIALAFVVAVSAPSGTRGRNLGGLLAGGLSGAAAISPWLLEVIRASAFSSRRIKGYSWTEFSAVWFHPGRFLETPFPLLLGDPSRAVDGGYWGFAFSQGNPPYLASVAFGVLPASLALLFVLSAKRSEGRWFVGIAGVALAASVFPALPFARQAYSALTPLHLFRYPLKALLAFSFALAALAALGADRLLFSGSLPRFRSRAAGALVAAAGLFAAAALAFRLWPDALRALLLAAWDPAWRTSPDAVLAPVLARLPIQAAASAAFLLLLAALVGRAPLMGFGRAAVVLAVSAELLTGARYLLPRLPASALDRPSPLALHAAALPGRLFERAGKDLDPIRRGAFGRAVSSVALAQWSQAWALSGAPFGLRYAYDRDPDGSYSFLTRVATDLVDGRPWPVRLKWLRATGVGSVIASDVPPELPGLAPVLVEGRAGIPATLYRLTEPLPGVRRASRVVGSTSVNEAADRFEAAGFDPAFDAVVAGTPPAGTGESSPDALASARAVVDGPDSVIALTSGSRPGLLVVDRTYTPRVRASVDGAGARVYAAYVHLIGVPVPAGTSTVWLELAP